MRRYIQIRTSISSDGLGVPAVSVYFSKCDKKEIVGHFCKDCHNSELQENNIGYNLHISEAIEILTKKINEIKSIFGECQLAILGGEPLSKLNKIYSKNLAEWFFGYEVKTILYTWRTLEDIKNERIDISYYDRIVCGSYIEDLKSEDYILGSENQYILDKNMNKIIEYRKE